MGHWRFALSGSDGLTFDRDSPTRQNIYGFVYITMDFLLLLLGFIYPLLPKWRLRRIQRDRRILLLLAEAEMVRNLRYFNCLFMYDQRRAGFRLTFSGSVSNDVCTKFYQYMH